MNKDTEIKQGQKLETGNRSTVKINPSKESLKEVLTKNTSVKDVVHDFVHSKNAKFSKDSTKGRIKRALGAWYGMHPEKSTKEEFVNEGDFWHPDPEKDRKLGGPGANQRAREDGAAASKPKEDPKKLRPGESYMQYAKRHGYKSKNESHVPGQPAERLGAVTAIPQSERDAAKARILAKAAAKRKEREMKREEFEIDEAIRNPESRKKLRDIMNTDTGRKGDASKGENPRSKYPSERSKQALNLLHGSGETGSKDNPVRSRGGTSAPPEERSRSAANRKYWAATAGPTRDRGAGNKAARRASELSKEEFEIDEATRFEKETGKDYKTGKEVTKGGTLSGNDTNTKVMRHMHKVMGAGRMGSNGPIQPRGQKKVPGKKPPEAGKYGSERRSPEQIVKNRRAARQQGQDNQSSRFD